LTEEQTEYEKTITFTKLAKYMFGFMFAKIMRDVDKQDPLTTDISNLKVRTDEERSERLRAYWIWQSNKTPQNATDALNEIADEINFLVFQGGIIAGYQHMKRE